MQTKEAAMNKHVVLFPGAIIVGSINARDYSCPLVNID